MYVSACFLNTVASWVPLYWVFAFSAPPDTCWVSVRGNSSHPCFFCQLQSQLLSILLFLCKNQHNNIIATVRCLICTYQLNSNPNPDPNWTLLLSLVQNQVLIYRWCMYLLGKVLELSFDCSIASFSPFCRGIACLEVLEHYWQTIPLAVPCLLWV